MNLSVAHYRNTWFYWGPAGAANLHFGGRIRPIICVGFNEAHCYWATAPPPPPVAKLRPSAHLVTVKQANLTNFHLFHSIQTWSKVVTKSRRVTITGMDLETGGALFTLWTFIWPGQGPSVSIYYILQAAAALSTTIWIFPKLCLSVC